MSPQSRYPEIAICSVLVFLSVAGVIWYEESGLLKRDIDGLLLLSICVLTGSIFSLQLISIARSAGWFKSLVSYRVKQRSPSEHADGVADRAF
jgi:hypothetical protein